MKRQFPRNETVWGDCIFSFDPDLRQYDWVVVYDDLPSLNGKRFSLRSEKLACPISGKPVEEYNLFALLAKEIQQRYRPA